MSIVTVGIDLAKNVFAVHGVKATDKPVPMRRSVPSAKLAELMTFLQTHPPAGRPSPIMTICPSNWLAAPAKHPGSAA